MKTGNDCRAEYVQEQNDPLRFAGLTRQTELIEFIHVTPLAIE
jgi:hypothetical protein